jgi:hypothetical protein
MGWSIEGTDEFQIWFAGLTAAEQSTVIVKIDMLEEKGPALGRPHADTLKGSKITNLKELRIQHAGKPYRVLFVFDRRQSGILLVGGRKADDKWYKTAIPAAEKIYKQYLKEIEEEKKNAKKLATD